MENKTNSRRKFLKTASLSTAAVAAGVVPVFAHEAMAPQLLMHKGTMLKISPDPEKNVFKPLDEITISGFKKGIIQVLDGNGNLLLSKQVNETPFSYKVGGALGIQSILYLNKKQELLDWTTYKIDAKTELKDKGARYEKLLATLYWSMAKGGAEDLMRYNGKIYEFFVRWLRDHVHTMKGMKYFYPNLKSAIDLYADTQRSDGMIFDNLYPRDHGTRPTYWDKIFPYGGFIEISDDELYELKRIPVENDVEYLFLEGIYYTWKATGDTEWMKSLLDKALKAVEYSTTNPYRWSTKYQLLKRGHTIDTWDFQSSITYDVTGHVMVVDLEKTKFGIMHGDNTGMAAGLSYLSEMLEVANRPDDAKRMKQLEKELRERLDKLSWNGNFFTHHVPEDTTFDYKQLGPDPETQVSLSNSYALNRGITHEQAVAIIKTYQRIRGEMPETSPGEWYTIYPPFEWGYEPHSKKWEYMNGGVLSIVAGELAHGAFEHGYETYGADILKRVADLAQTTDNYLHCTYRGALPEKPKRNFTTLSLAKVANGDTRGEGAPGVRGWFDEDPNNDLRNLPTGLHSYQEIPFDVANPATNNSKSCLLLSSAGNNYATQITLPVNKKAASIYFLHACARSADVGTITIEYEDGTIEVDYINGDKISPWYMPADRKNGNCRLGWWGANGNFTNVGCAVYGYNNPNPDKEITNIRFDSFKNAAAWGVLAITLCDSPVFFMPDTVSFGIPDDWGAAAVTYALLEGLAGVKDTGVSFDKVRFAPRWEAAGVAEVNATIKYEASSGYVSYKYEKREKILNMLITGNGKTFDTELLLPEDALVKTVTVNGETQPFTIHQVEESTYCCFGLDGIGVKDVTVILG